MPFSNVTAITIDAAADLLATSEETRREQLPGAMAQWLTTAEGASVLLLQTLAEGAILIRSAAST
jgi:hypothetical protein